MPKKNKPTRENSPNMPVKKALQKAAESAPVFAEIEDVTKIVTFLANFQEIIDPRAQHPSRLISLKVPEPLLAAFRFKADRAGIPYQTMIKRLMTDWLRQS